jgi:hypothetical protein
MVCTAYCENTWLYIESCLMNAAPMATPHNGHVNLTNRACVIATGPSSPGNNMYSSVGYGSNAAAAGADGNAGSPYRGVRLSPSAAKDPAVLGSRSGIPAASSAAGPTPANAAGGQAAGAGGGVRGLTAAANAALGGPRFASPPQAGTGRGGGAGGRAAATSPRIDGKEFFRQAR